MENIVIGLHRSEKLHILARFRKTLALVLDGLLYFIEKAKLIP